VASFRIFCELSDATGARGKTSLRYEIIRSLIRPLCSSVNQEYTWQYISRLTDEHTSLYSSVPITFLDFGTEEDI
jgi:hypothetical protein